MNKRFSFYTNNSSDKRKHTINSAECIFEKNRKGDISYLYEILYKSYMKDYLIYYYTKNHICIYIAEYFFDRKCEK